MVGSLYHGLAPSERMVERYHDNMLRHAAWFQWLAGSLSAQQQRK